MHECTPHDAQPWTYSEVLVAIDHLEGNQTRHSGTKILQGYNSFYERHAPTSDSSVMVKLSAMESPWNWHPFKNLHQNDTLPVTQTTLNHALPKINLQNACTSSKPSPNAVPTAC